MGTYLNVLGLILCEKLMSIIVFIREQPLQSDRLAAQGALQGWA